MVNHIISSKYKSCVYKAIFYHLKLTDEVFNKGYSNIVLKKVNFY